MIQIAYVCETGQMEEFNIVLTLFSDNLNLATLNFGTF